MQNLKEKVYLLLYSKPNYKRNISKILYGKESKTINRIWKELEQDNPPWIIPKKTTVNKLDGRSWSQKNYISSIEPLFLSICKDLEKIENNLKKKNKNKIHFLTKINNINLTEDEKKALLNVLKNDIFRKFVNSIIQKFGDAYNYDNQSFCLNLIKKQLANLCAFLLCSEYIFSMLYHNYHCLNDDDIPSYDKYISIRYQYYHKKKKFNKISDALLSLGVKVLEKLSYLDYNVSQTLFIYLMRSYRLLYDQLPYLCEVSDDAILEDFYPSYDSIKDDFFY
jgi:hypothetical protein